MLFSMNKVFKVSSNEIKYFLHKVKPAKEENIKQAFKRTRSNNSIFLKLYQNGAELSFVLFCFLS